MGYQSLFLGWHIIWFVSSIGGSGQAYAVGDPKTWVSTAIAGIPKALKPLASCGPRRVGLRSYLMKTSPSCLSTRIYLV